MYKLNRNYFLLWVVLLAIEIIIALYVHDAYIRPFGGDFLVVILIYCLIKSFIDSDVNRTIMGVLLFAYALETLQYFHIVEILGVQDSVVARTVIGTYFAWTDMLMYTLGMLLVWLAERRWKKTWNTLLMKHQ